jgi:transketolase
MSEQKKLLKKAVMAGVGASASVDRIKTALNDVMQDLVKVGQELFDELETKGKDKTDSFSKELKKIQDEAARRTQDAEKKVSTKFQGSTKKVAKEAGLATREDLEDVLERLHALEEAVHGTSEHNGGDDEAQETTKKRSRKSSKE